MKNGRILDEKIDNTQLWVDVQLGKSEPRIAQLRAEQKAYDSWSLDNVIDIAYSAVSGGVALDRKSIEASIFSEQDKQASEKGEFSKKFAIAMQDRPGGLANALSWTFGQSAKNKQVFLNELSEKAKTLVANAEEELADLEKVLSDKKDQLWSQIEQVTEYYNNLVQAVTTQDTNMILSSIEGSDTQDISGSIKGALLAKPLNEYDNAVLAIAGMDIADQETEKQIVSAMVESFDDGTRLDADFKALQFIQGSTFKIEDSDVRSRYQEYAHAFAGMLIPINGLTINVNSIKHCGYDGEQLWLRGIRNQTREYTMSREEADIVMSGLDARINFFKPTGGISMNTDLIRQCGYDGENLWFSHTHGNNREFEMGRDEAYAVMKRLTDGHPNFFAVGGLVINTNNVVECGYDSKNKELWFNELHGNGREFEMERVEADAVIATLKERPNFFAPKGSMLVNTHHIVESGYNGEELWFDDTRGLNARKFKMERSAASEVLKTLADDQDFISPTSTLVMNTNHIVDGQYEEGTLSLSHVRGGTRELEMKCAEADAIIDGLMERSNFLSPFDDAIVNADQMIEVGHDGEKLWFYPTRGEGLDTKMEKEKARAIIDKLGEHPNFLAAGGLIMNAHYIRQGSYYEGEFWYSKTIGNSREFEMDRSAAIAALNGVRETGQKLEAIKTANMVQNPARRRSSGYTAPSSFCNPVGTAIAVDIITPGGLF